MFVIGKKLFHKSNVSKNETLEKNVMHRQLNKLKTNEVTSKGLFIQIILSLAIIWSFLSFPMIYWNHNGEWWPFFDDIPILQWPSSHFMHFIISFC